MIKISRQLKRQRDFKAAGLCPKCGEKPDENYITCKKCCAKQRARKEKLRLSVSKKLAKKKRRNG